MIDPISKNEAADILIDREYLPRSYYQFFKDAWHVFEPGVDYVDNWHIKYLCWRLHKEVLRIKNKQHRQRHIIINVPPRSSKSNIATVALNAFAWILEPKIRFISLSYADSLAEEHSIKSKTLMQSPWYQERFGDLYRFVGKNTNHIYGNDKGGRRIATSVGGSVTGKGGDILLVDDPIDPQKAESKTIRDRTNRWMKNTLMNRLNDPDIGVVIIIMQRLHEDDVTGHMIARDPDKWEHIILPADDNYPIKPQNLSKYYKNGLFFPERFSRRTLESMAKDYGSRSAAGQLGQQPSDPEGNIFMKKDIKIVEKSEFEELRMSLGLNPYFYMDTAYTDDTENDPNGFAVVFPCGGDLYVYDCHDKRMEFPELIKYTEKWTHRNHYDPVHSKVKIEPKASGKSVVQYLKRKTPMNVMELKPPTDGKLVRANACTPFVESGRLILVKGDWNDRFIDQFTTFPNATHDDMTDVIMHAIEDTQSKKRKGNR